MACNLTKGRAINCKDIAGGISAIYVTNFGGLGTITYSSDQISNMSGEFTIFKYDLNGSANTMTTTATSSRDNGTTSFASTLSISLPKLSKEDNAELKLLAYGRPHIIVADRNGNAFLMGTTNGCSLDTATSTTGAGFQDMSGYTMEFSSEETTAPDFINGATAANPLAGMSSATVTVTVGTNS